MAYSTRLGGFVYPNGWNSRENAIFSGMRSRPEEMEEFAEECRRRSAGSNDPYLKRLFDDMALDWEHLAALRRRIEADRKNKIFRG